MAPLQGSVVSVLSACIVMHRHANLANRLQFVPVARLPLAQTALWRKLTVGLGTYNANQVRKSLVTVLISAHLPCLASLATGIRLLDHGQASQGHSSTGERSTRQPPTPRRLVRHNPTFPLPTSPMGLSTAGPASAILTAS